MIPVDGQESGDIDTEELIVETEEQAQFLSWMEGGPEIQSLHAYLQTHDVDLASVLDFAIERAESYSGEQQRKFAGLLVSAMIEVEQDEEPNVPGGGSGFVHHDHLYF